MDFSRFKKLSSNKDHTVMEHPDGHRITIKHSKLHAKVKKELDALPIHKADGGMINSIGKENYSSKRKNYDLGGNVNQEKAEQFQKGSVFNKEGKKAEPAPEAEIPRSNTNSEDAADAGQQKTAYDYYQKTGKESMGTGGEVNPKLEQSKKVPPKAHYAEGTPDAPVSAYDAELDAPQAKDPQLDDAAPAQQPINLTINNSGAQPGGASPQGGAPQQDPNLAKAMSQMQQMQGKSPATPQATPQSIQPGLTPEQAATGMFPAGMPNTESAYNQGQGGVALQTQAEQDQAKAEAQRLKAAAAADFKLKLDFQQNYQAIQQHRQELQELYASPEVKPQTIMQKAFEGKDTFGKISAGIGMILGGMSGGMLGTENPVIKMYNQQIERDIEQQKLNLGKKENLLKMNLQDLGNLHDATNMTRLQMSDMIGHQLKLEAAKAADPLARARGLQAAGELEAKRAPIAQELAISRTLFNGGAGGQPKVQDPSLFVRYRVPQAEQKDAMKEISEATMLKKTQSQLLDAFDKVSQLQTPGNRFGSPIQSHSQLNAITGNLTASLAKDTAGKYTEADAKAIDALWPGAADNAQTRALKRNQMIRLSEGKLGADNFPTLRSNGIDLGKFDQFKSVPSVDLAAPETRVVNGHTYQKAQGGWKLVK